MKTNSIPFDIYHMSFQDLEEVIKNSNLYLDGYVNLCQKEIDRRLYEHEHESIIIEWQYFNQNKLYI